MGSPGDVPTARQRQRLFAYPFRPFCLLEISSQVEGVCQVDRLCATHKTLLKLLFKILDAYGQNVAGWVKTSFTMWKKRRTNSIRLKTMGTPNKFKSICTVDLSVWRALTDLESLFLIEISFVAGVTVLLSLTVFSIMVTEMLPKLSDAAPILGGMSEKSGESFCILTLHHRSSIFTPLTQGVWGENLLLVCRQLFSTHERSLIQYRACSDWRKWMNWAHLQVERKKSNHKINH